MANDRQIEIAVPSQLGKYSRDIELLRCIAARKTVAIAEHCRLCHGTFRKPEQERCSSQLAPYILCSPRTAPHRAERREVEKADNRYNTVLPSTGFHATTWRKVAQSNYNNLLL